MTTRRVKVPQSVPLCPPFPVESPVNRVDDRLAGHPPLLSQSAGRSWPLSSTLLPTHPNICTLHQPLTAYQSKICPNIQTNIGLWQTFYCLLNIGYPLLTPNSTPPFVLKSMNSK